MMKPQLSRLFVQFGVGLIFFFDFASIVVSGFTFVKLGGLAPLKFHPIPKNAMVQVSLLHTRPTTVKGFVLDFEGDENEAVIMKRVKKAINAQGYVQLLRHKSHHESKPVKQKRKLAVCMKRVLTNKYHLMLLNFIQRRHFLKKMMRNSLEYAKKLYDIKESDYVL